MKDGLGTLILAGSDTYTGETSVNAGTLIVASVNALPDGSNLAVGAGGALLFDPAAVALPAMNLSVTVAVPEPGTLVPLVLAVCAAAVHRGIRIRR